MTSNGEHTKAEAELRNVPARYRADLARALEVRDEALRRAAAAGLKQVDIVRITGYTRETVRQALNPEIKEAVRRAAEERKAARAMKEEGA
jgi:hypothetical protein